MQKNSPRVSYYRTDERTAAGEVIFHFRFYAANGRCQEFKAIAASALDATLEDIRKQGMIATRINL
jgi:hypothetical protein